MPTQRGAGRAGGAGRPPATVPPMRSVVIVGAGTFGASLAWWLARAGDDGDARRPVRARRPARDVGRRVAADPLRARPGRRLHRVGAARAHAVARARGRVRRGRCSSSAGLTWFAHREDGWEAQSDRHVRPRRASRASGSRPRRARGCSPASTPPGSRSCCTSRRRACCAPSGRSARSPARRPRTARRCVRARATPDGDRVRLEDGRTLEGDVVVWACGPWLGALFAEHARDPLDPPGAVLLRRRPGVARADDVPGLRRLRPGDLRHARPRRPRREGGAGLRRTAARPRRRAARPRRARARRSRARSSPSASRRWPTRRSPARRPAATS